jgi:hypothetical protein
VTLRVLHLRAMPTKHRRIAIVEDEELAASLAEVSKLRDGQTSKARLVRDLALKGAERVLEEESGRREALEWLVWWSTSEDGMDRGALLAARESWGHKEEW